MEFMSSDDKRITRIYMPLQDEGTLVARPVDAEILGDDTYQVLPPKIATSEIWEFPPGSIVRCKKEVWSTGEILVARELL